MCGRSSKGLKANSSETRCEGFAEAFEATGCSAHAETPISARTAKPNPGHKNLVFLREATFSGKST
jgi:hypothetical protein